MLFRLKCQGQWHELDASRLPVGLVHEVLWQLRERLQEQRSLGDPMTAEYVAAVEDGGIVRRIAFQEEDEATLQLRDLIHQILEHRKRGA